MADNELRVLLPDNEMVLNGESITIKPFPFGAIPKVITKASYLIQMVVSLPSDLLTEEGDINMDDPATVIILSSMLENGSDTVFDILSLAIKKPVSWIEELAPDEGIMLLAKVWEVNKDFFMRRLGPMLQGLQKNQAKPNRKKSLTDGEESLAN